MELNRYFREDSTTYRKQGIVIFDFDDTKCMECKHPIKDVYLDC